VETRRVFELPATTFNRPVALLRHRLEPAKELARPRRRREAPGSKGDSPDGAECQEDSPDAADADHARTQVARRALRATVALADTLGGHLSGLADGRTLAPPRIFAALADAYGLQSRIPLARGQGLQSRAPLARGRGRKAAAGRETGFGHPVELAVRTRAGRGDPGDACCEACGIWLGPDGGEIQHRDAGGMGGSLDSVNWPTANAALLCGNSALGTGDRGLAERRDPVMYAMGFWLRNGQDPRFEPIVLHGRGGGGITVWLSEDGRYLYGAPQSQAFAPVPESADLRDCDLSPATPEADMANESPATPEADMANER
jgi:hypothetical protein